MWREREDQLLWLQTEANVCEQETSVRFRFSRWQPQRVVAGLDRGGYGWNRSIGCRPLGGRVCGCG